MQVQYHAKVKAQSRPSFGPHQVFHSFSRLSCVFELPFPIFSAYSVIGMNLLNAQLMTDVQITFI